MCAGRPFFIRIGVSQASDAPASSSARQDAGPEPRVEVVDVGLQHDSRRRTSAGRRPRRFDRRPGAGTLGRRPSCRDCRRPARSRATAIGGSAAVTVARVGQQGGPGRRAQLARRPGRRGPRARCAAAAPATAGPGIGMTPCAVVAVPPPRAIGETCDARPGRARTKPAHDPDDVARSRRARPTSWKWTSSGVDAVHPASATASRSKTSQRQPADPARRGRPARAATGRRARCGAAQRLSVVVTCARATLEADRAARGSTSIPTGTTAAAAAAHRRPGSRPDVSPARRAARRAACRRWPRVASTQPIRPLALVTRQTRPLGDRRATRAAKTPAPYPLSMLTTDDAGRAGVEHRQQRGQTAEARCRSRRSSGRRRAVRRSGRRPRWAGRPPCRPPRSGSRPRRAGRGRRAAGAGRRPRRRRSGRPPAPCTRAVRAASAATGASEVPADSTATRPRGGRQRTERRGAGDLVDLGRRAARRRTAASAARSSRVARTARSGCALVQGPQGLDDLLGRSCRRRRRPRGRRCGARGRRRGGRTRGPARRRRPLARA